MCEGHPSVREFQEAALQRASTASGRVGELLYFYAACGDEERLSGLKSQAAGGHPEDHLAYVLLAGAAAKEDHRTLRDLGGQTEAPWFLDALAAHWLACGKPEEAARLVEDAVGRGCRPFDAMNRIARHAAATGHTDQGRALSAMSLNIAPEQHDLRRLVDDLEQGVPMAPPQYYRPCEAGSVAFYLPCYNVAAHLERTLTAIFAQSHPLDEVLVIDDGSEDDLAGAIAPFPVRLLRHDTNRGLAAARNTAWCAATAEFIASVDTDASPAPDYIRNALTAFEQGPPELALVGGRLLEAFTRTPADAWRARSLSQDPGTARWYLDPGRNGGEVSIGEAKFLTGSNTLARRAALEAVGGYDERHRTNAEDVSLCAALRAKGYHYVFSPDCVATHYRRDTVVSVLNTAWNYTYWRFHDNGCYQSPATIIALADDRILAGLNYMAGAIADGRRDLVYIEYLYGFYCTARDLRHGVKKSVMTAGEAATIWRGLEGLTGDLDGRFGGDLAGKVRGDIAQAGLAYDAPVQPLETGAAERLQHVMDNLRADLQAVNITLYQLLLGP